MRIRPGIIIVIVAVFVVLFGGRYLGWFGGKSKDVASNSEPTTAATPETSPSSPEVSPSTTPRLGRNPARPTVPIPQPPANTTAPQVPVTPPTTATITDWEEKIDNVLTAQEEDPQKAKRLLDLFPNLPEDGQVEAAQHLSNLLPDEQYAALAQTLTNAIMPEAVLDVLMTDVLNRPNKLKLDTLFDVARVPNHPKAEEALDILEVFLDEVDWDAVKASGNWETVRTEKDKWLKENPDEE